MFLLKSFLLKSKAHFATHISCSKEYFDKPAPAHNNALTICGFNENIEFTLTPHQEGPVTEKS